MDDKIQDANVMRLLSTVSALTLFRLCERLAPLVGVDSAMLKGGIIKVYDEMAKETGNTAVADPAPSDTERPRGQWLGG